LILQRHFDSKQKVVLSHHRERQLREIFDGIDLNKKGEINIVELEEAIEFVNERIKNIKGLEAFKDLKALFRSMDDNGDGTVDFQEFTSGDCISFTIQRVV
jgi:Ca2+-binding EF-hand superfamily protein